MTDIEKRAILSSKNVLENTVTKKSLNKIFQLVTNLKDDDDLYQLLLVHLQEKNTNYFFNLIAEALPTFNQTIRTSLKTFLHDKNLLK